MSQESREAWIVVAIIVITAVLAKGMVMFGQAYLGVPPIEQVMPK